MQVTVVGLGYVGLVTSAGLAAWGHRVVGADINAHRVDSLAAGSMPFFEPGLAELVTEARHDGRLTFAAPDEASIADADLVITAVGTHDGNGGWQTRTMETCLSQVVPHLGDDAYLVVRSTLPPEYVRTLPSIVAELRREVGRPMVPVLMSPEFTREGQAVRDFLHPDRLVIGVAHDPDGSGEAKLRALLADAHAPILTMPAIDAAFSKLAANLFLATKISFANELARLCEAHGAAIDQVVASMSYDPRIGGAFLRPGVGFGGSCLPHQVAMSVKSAEVLGVPSPLLSAVWEVNQAQRDLAVLRVEELLGGLIGMRVAMLGLTFKPETDDLRDAPAITIARRLLDHGARVVAYDPMRAARERAAAILPGLVVEGSALDALAGSDATIVVTEWSEFNQLDWHEVGRRMRRRIVIDGRNALDPAELTSAGFQYSGFGRASAAGAALPGGGSGLEPATHARSSAA